MLLNRQKEIGLDMADLRVYLRRVRGALKLGRREFNVCFVNDEEISRMNSVYRAKSAPTDVLSFPWLAGGENGAERLGCKVFQNFLGDIVISASTADRNARKEGHSTQDEIRWLILHGVLHLLGYDHERDQGEMTALELSLRERLAGC
jgi:rRNA maturation RNase YbeY